MYFLDKTNFSQFLPTKILSFKNHQERSLYMTETSDLEKSTYKNPYNKDGPLVTGQTGRIRQ